MDSLSGLRCGFCRRGTEVENVCGKLWHSAKENCTAHHKCMQYSACLVQYTSGKFGGFRVDKVQREITRGRLLKCAICRKSSDKKWRKIGGATAGCAIGKCPKTFHFYCAATDTAAMTRRIEMTMRDSGRKVVSYRVFCSPEHKQLYEKNEVNEINYMSHSEEASDSETDTHTERYNVGDDDATEVSASATTTLPFKDTEGAEDSATLAAQNVRESQASQSVPMRDDGIAKRDDVVPMMSGADGNSGTGSFQLKPDEISGQMTQLLQCDETVLNIKQSHQQQIDIDAVEEQKSCNNDLMTLSRSGVAECTALADRRSRSRSPRRSSLPDLHEKHRGSETVNVHHVSARHTSAECDAVTYESEVSSSNVIYGHQRNASFANERLDTRDRGDGASELPVCSVVGSERSAQCSELYTESDVPVVTPTLSADKRQRIEEYLRGIEAPYQLQTNGTDSMTTYAENNL